MDDLNRIDTRHYHQILMDMLITFDKMCKEQGMTYSLAGGTLLGAVRHQGFIPWDDDVDVFLLRPDYEKFIEIYSKKELPKPYYNIVTLKNGVKEIPFARMLDMRVGVQHARSNSVKTAWIDIVPLDAVPKKKQERKRLIRKLSFYRKVRIVANSKFGSGRTIIHVLIRSTLGPLVRLFHLQNAVCKRMDNLAKKYPFDQADYFSEIVAKANFNGKGRIDTFTKPDIIEFEGYPFMCMPDYDSYLRGQYGDNYMRLLPKEERIAHGVATFVNEDYFKEKGIKLPECNRQDILIEG